VLLTPGFKGGPYEPVIEKWLGWDGANQRPLDDHLLRIITLMRHRNAHRMIPVLGGSVPNVTAHLVRHWPDPRNTPAAADRQTYAVPLENALIGDVDAVNTSPAASPDPTSFDLACPEVKIRFTGVPIQ